jgi:uncharacterized membrane protein
MLRRLASLMAVPVLVAGLLFTAPQPGWAASGGRIGGGSFRSAPSGPRNYGGGGSYRRLPESGYRGGYRGGYPGGYGGYGYPGGYGGGYVGGGIGFPFIVPIFGFGGGGLLGFLVLMAVVGLLLNAVRGAGSEALPDSASGRPYGSLAGGTVSIAEVQVGLLASARELQADLRRMAATADTASSTGLQRVLQETTLALLRHPDLWVYASGDVGQVPFSSAESTFNRLTMRERSKLQRELTTNVAGKRFSEPASVAVGHSDVTSDYIAVTLLVATRRGLSLKGADSAEELRETLQKLGAVGEEDLLALEVIWQPEGAGEVLSSEELLTAYPEMQHL